MPSGKAHTHIEISKFCGITKTFNNNRQADMWEKIHKKCCEKCRNVDTMLHQAQVVTDYNSISTFLFSKQAIQQQRLAVLSTPFY